MSQGDKNALRVISCPLPGVPGALEPRMYPRSEYFLVKTKIHQQD